MLKRLDAKLQPEKLLLRRRLGLSLRSKRRGRSPDGNNLICCSKVVAVMHRTGMSADALMPLSWGPVNSWGGMAGLWMLAQIKQKWIDSTICYEHCRNMNQLEIIRQVVRNRFWSMCHVSAWWGWQRWGDCTNWHWGWTRSPLNKASYKIYRCHMWDNRLKFIIRKLQLMRSKSLKNLCHIFLFKFGDTMCFPHTPDRKTRPS